MYADFRFELYSLSLPTVVFINIHAGVNGFKDFRRWIIDELPATMISTAFVESTINHTL